MDTLREVFVDASNRLRTKHDVVEQTHQHVAAHTVRTLDPAVTALRARRLVNTPLIANALDKDVVQELKCEPDIDKWSERTQRQLEGVLAEADFMPVWFLQRGAELRRTVAKIQAKNLAGLKGEGTGFLVGPGLLLTNAHVLDWSDEDKGTLQDIVGNTTVVFDLEERFDGSHTPSTTFALDPATLLLSSPWFELDYVLVALQPASVDGKAHIDDYGYNRLTGDLGKIARGEPVFIIQHPAGKTKQVVVNSNRLIERDEASNYLVYEADTDQGSSGAPVFNRQWEVVALHHSVEIARDADGWILTKDGKRWEPGMGVGAVRFLKLNEGIRISRILRDLDTHANALAGNGAASGGQVASAAGLERLRAMLATKAAQAPASLVAPVPIERTQPIASAVSIGPFARPD